MQSQAHRRSVLGAVRTLGLLGLSIVLCAPGCKLVRKTVELPGKVLNPGGHSSGSGSTSLVQSAVMRFADTFHAQILQSTDEFAQAAGTPEARAQALSWRVEYATSALTIATGPNPKANLLDMVALVSLGRIAHEEYWMPEVWKDADKPLVDAFDRLEDEIWALAGQTFTQRQLEDVRETIQEWKEKNPGKALTAFVRMPSYRKLVETRPTEKRSDVFQQMADLLSLDPFEGLEPARREAAEMRALGERTLYYAQRAPLILQAQAELLGLRMVADVESAREPATSFLTEARATLAEGKEMSKEVREGIATLDAFIARVSTDKTPGDQDRPGRPFDVREYGEAAAKVGEAAKELDRVIARFDEDLPQVKPVVEEVAQRTDRVVDRATWRLLLAGSALIVLASAAALAVRRISSRWSVPPRRDRGFDRSARRETWTSGFARRNHHR